VAVWTCPECERTFGRRGQGHLCIPATTVDEWFADEPPEHREIHERIADHLEALGDVRIEAVAVGIFYKRRRNLAELRGRADHLGLSFVRLSGRDHERFTRRTPMKGGQTWYRVALRHPDDVDDQVLEWLTEAWDLSG
jgi:Domain of unknown function (DUF5655)